MIAAFTLYACDAGPDAPLDEDPTEVRAVVNTPPPNPFIDVDVDAVDDLVSDRTVVNAARPGPRS